MVKNIIISITVLGLLTGCMKDFIEERPEEYDGTYSIEVTTVYEDSIVTNITVSLSTTEYQFEELTAISDSNGKVVFSELPWANYRVRGNGIISLPDLEDPTIFDNYQVSDTSLYLSPDSNCTVVNDIIHVVATNLPLVLTGTKPGLKINEIYTCGPVNNFYYFYDQFFELYNSSADTIYLDGMVFCRMGSFLANVTYIFQFPGTPLTGRDWPVAPGEYKVLAGDAYDHRMIVSGSVDLSQADFEFRNRLDYGDYDNPDVPNLDNIEVGHTRDFLVGVTADVLLIADGSDLNYLDGMDINSVIDCVEFSASATHEKDIEKELDRSYGGIGQIKYSGSSLERRLPGFDSNSSADDFVIITAPTPGYHHTDE
ncbi:MAG: DUF4876 domain-containing protein [Candidatus Neomarinimicrobiota bacterium]